jgi:hypothetical protein
VELHLNRQRSRPVRRTFVAGQPIQLSDADVALRNPTGVLRLTVTPANAQVTVAGSGAAPKTLTGNSMELEEGAYTITARAPGYVDRSETVKIAGGQTVTLPLALNREQAQQARPAAAAVVGMEGWADPKAWQADAGWFKRRGGGFILFRPMDRAGNYAFNAMVVSGGLLGGKELEWVVGYTDPRNYVACRLDAGEYRRIQSVNGKKSELVKKNHGLNLKEEFMVTVRVETTPGVLTQYIRTDGKWLVLDTWSVTGRDFTRGQFGFNLGGRDKIRISGFGFHPKE